MRIYEQVEPWEDDLGAVDDEELEGDEDDDAIGDDGGDDEDEVD